MSFHAANSACFSYLSSCPVESANKSLSTRNYGCELRPSSGGHVARIALRLRRTSAASAQMRTLLWRVSAVMYPVFYSVTASGPFRRPAALDLLLRILRLRGLGSSQNKFENPGKERLSNFFRAPPRKQTFGTWEPGPLAKLRPV